MNANQTAALEQYVASRLLAIVELLADHSGLEVPILLQVVEGDTITRNLVRLGEVAEFLEAYMLETIQPGLSAKLAEYDMASLEELRKATADDLMVINGVGKQTVAKILDAVTVAPPTVRAIVEAAEVEVLDEPLPSNWLDEIIEDENAEG